MNSYFLTGYFQSVDAYAINDFALMSLGAITDITNETDNGDASFLSAVFVVRGEVGS